MLILAIDTSTNTGSIALYDSKKGVIGEITLNVKQNHSVISMTVLDTLLSLTKVKKEEIDKIAVSIGPGSFTGIRIGVGIAKGLAYALKKPIVGVNELDLLSRAYQGDKKVISIIDARKERVFYGVYKGKRLVADYGAEELRVILKLHEDEEIFLVGDGAITYKDIIDEELKDRARYIQNSFNIPRASLLAEISIDREDNLFNLEPFYVSKPQAEKERIEKQQNI